MSTLRDIFTAVRSDLTTAVSSEVSSEDVTYVDQELPASTDELPSVVYEVFTNRRPIGTVAPAPTTVYNENGSASGQEYEEYVTAQFDIRVLANDVDATLTLNELVRQQFLPYNDGKEPQSGPYGDDVDGVQIDDGTPSDTDAIRGRMVTVLVHFQRKSTESVTPIDEIRVDQDDDGATDYTITDST